MDLCLLPLSSEGLSQAYYDTEPRLIQRTDAFSRLLWHFDLLKLMTIRQKKKKPVNIDIFIIMGSEKRLQIFINPEKTHTKNSQIRFVWEKFKPKMPQNSSWSLNTHYCRVNTYENFLFYFSLNILYQKFKSVWEIWPCDPKRRNTWI